MIPKIVRVGAMTYSVEKTDGPIFNDKGGDLYGRIDYNSQVIKISGDSRFSEQTQFVTFFHELVHAFTRERGLDWGDKDELYTEEIGKAIHAFFIDNGIEFPKEDKAI